MVAGGTAVEAHARIVSPAPGGQCPQASYTVQPEFGLEAAARDTHVLLTWRSAAWRPLDIYEGRSKDIC